MRQSPRGPIGSGWLSAGFPMRPRDSVIVVTVVFAIASLSLAFAGPPHETASRAPTPTVRASSPVEMGLGADRRIRDAAEALARYGRERNAPTILLGAVHALLRTGGRLTSDDPWRTAEWLDEAERLASGQPALLASIDELRNGSAEVGRVERGVLDGPIRYEITLDPGATASFELLVAADEVADVEGRLKRGSEGADVDLTVRDAAGVTVAQDHGTITGRLGYAAYVAWAPAHCDVFTLEVTNRGSAPAALVLLTARANTRNCDGAGR